MNEELVKMKGRLQAIKKYKKRHHFYSSNNWLIPLEWVLNKFKFKFNG